MLNNRMRALILTLALTIAAFGLLGVPSKRVAAQSTPSVWLYCISLGHQRLECQYSVTGGTGVYTTYKWTPTPQIIGPDMAIVPCARAYRNQIVTLTVTDSNGATGTTSYTAYCGDAV